MKNRIGKVEQSGRQGDCDCYFLLFCFILLNGKSWKGCCVHTFGSVAALFLFLALLILLFAIHDGRICNQEPLGDVVDEINTIS